MCIMQNNSLFYDSIMTNIKLLISQKNNNLPLKLKYIYKFNEICRQNKKNTVE